MTKRISSLCLVALAMGLASGGAIAKESNQKPDIYDNENKHVDDPTRIVTRLGLGSDYNFESEQMGYAITGSIGLSEAQKINARYHPETDEWSLGGSWLFDFGIVNFNFGRSEYEDGSNFNNYNIGTFVPLSVFGIEPNGWQIFPMAGFNYNEGEIAIEQQNASSFDSSLNEYVLHPTSSTGGYLGYFSLKPLDDKYTIMSFGGASVGSNDYFGYWFGVGAGYKFTPKDSIKLMGIVSDNDYGSDQKLVVSYSHTFSVE
ncbi:hypothetical protein [Vibrio ishigakensis]|nr:hypothetical protein [Vibrio ishigakensis]